MSCPFWCDYLINLVLERLLGSGTLNSGAKLNDHEVSCVLHCSTLLLHQATQLVCEHTQ